MQLTPENVRTITWLPSTCAYRLVAEGKDLFWWHPLVSGRAESVHEAGISMRGRVTASETEMADPQDYFDHMLEVRAVAAGNASRSFAAVNPPVDRTDASQKIEPNCGRGVVSALQGCEPAG